MSTGLECNFVEWKPKEWYYILEDWDAPKNAWDWREYATAYGPFSSEEEADKHLSDNHANPGGSCTIPYTEGETGAEDQVMLDLIANAKKPRKRLDYSYRRW
jgi:hypothetical protein